MSQAVIIGLYQPGSTVLHRLGVGPKLLGLAALSLVIVLVRDWPRQWPASPSLWFSPVLPACAGAHCCAKPADPGHGCDDRGLSVVVLRAAARDRIHA